MKHKSIMQRCHTTLAVLQGPWVDLCNGVCCPMTTFILLSDCGGTFLNSKHGFRLIANILCLDQVGTTQMLNNNKTPPPPMIYVYSVDLEN